MSDLMHSVKVKFDSLIPKQDMLTSPNITEPPFDVTDDIPVNVDEDIFTYPVP
jgi:hypothetical protein